MNRRNREKRKSGGGGYADAAKRAADHGSGRGPIEIPEGWTMFSPKGDKTYDLRFFPYVVGKGNPFCAIPGKMHYERTFYIHNQIGPNKDKVICAARTAGKKCPICEERAAVQANGGDKDDLKPFNSSERQLFIVKDMNERNGVRQLWHMSYFGFGELLDGRIKKSRPKLNWKNFFHLKGGFILSVSFKEKPIGDGKFVCAESIDFEEDPKSYSEEILKKIPCLDDLIPLPDYKELKAKFKSGMTDEEDPEDEETDDGDGYEEDDEKPKKKKKKRNRDDDDDEDSEDDDYDDILDEDEDDFPAKKKKKKRD